MGIKKTVFTLIIGAICNCLYSQDVLSFFIVDNDTTFCENLRYETTNQGYLKKLSYTDKNGKKVSFKKRKDVPDVTTFFVGGRLIDKTPLNPKKPNGYVRYYERMVDGKLKVYSNSIERNNSVKMMFISGNPGGGWQQSGKIVYRYSIKMPDGIFYDLKKQRNVDKYIKPFMLKCKQFKKNYKGDFNNKEENFLKTVTLYNKLCDDSVLYPIKFIELEPIKVN